MMEIENPLTEVSPMKQKYSLGKIVYIGVLAALVCVVTFFRFPLLGSKVHFANAMCLLSGLLMGPIPGGLAAGIGSVLYDALFGGYGLLDCAVTFVSKFLMAWVCAKIAFSADKEAKHHGWNIAASVIGALTYVALYMLKTFVFQKFVYGFPAETVFATMLAKLPASLINAVAAMIAAPILYTALRAALESAGILKHMRK